MKSRTLANVLNRWFCRQYCHNFVASNTGVSAAVCSRCNLVITVRGKVMDKDEQYFWLPKNDPSKRGYPSPHQLKRMIESVGGGIPACGIIQVLEIMDA